MPGHPGPVCGRPGCKLVRRDFEPATKVIRQRANSKTKHHQKHRLPCESDTARTAVLLSCRSRRMTLPAAKNARGARASAASPTARRTANKANAARSTGPRTRRGKARASRNALRHGLAALRPADHGDTMRIAGLMCDPANLLAHDQAVIIAECCALIARVRRARAAALERMALHELSALERYERRALSRRRRAIRALAALTSHSDRAFYEYNPELTLAKRTQRVRPPARPGARLCRLPTSSLLVASSRGWPGPPARGRRFALFGLQWRIRERCHADGRLHPHADRDLRRTPGCRNLL